MAEPSVCSVITGARRVEHVISNVRAAGWKLASGELKEIEAIFRPEDS